MLVLHDPTHPSVRVPCGFTMHYFWKRTRHASQHESRGWGERLSQHQWTGDGDCHKHPPYQEGICLSPDIFRLTCFACICQLICVLVSSTAVLLYPIQEETFRTILITYGICGFLNSLAVFIVSCTTPRPCLLWVELHFMSLYDNYLLWQNLAFQKTCRYTIGCKTMSSREQSMAMSRR